MRYMLQLLVLIGILFSLNYVMRELFGFRVSTFYSAFIFLGVVSVAVVIFLENRHPSKTLAWIFFLALVPVGGLFFYFIFGRNYYKSKKFDQKAVEDAKSFAFIDRTSEDHQSKLASYEDDERRLMNLAGKIAHSPVSFSTSSTVLKNGDETFSAILAELEQATDHIHMEYYIYRHDEIGTKIQQLLIEKAKQGLEIRFLYDAVGCLTLPPSFLQEMSNAGVELAAFNKPSVPLFSSKMNFRNHRKIIVIDGKVGFIGGLNVGDEYLGKSKTYGFWRDTHLMLVGEGVWSLQIIFQRDWHYVTGKSLWDREYFHMFSQELGGRGAVQIVASGPDQTWKSAKNLFFEMITMARRTLWIATPYFIPDEDILTALTVAALSGVDVKILFPKHPDKWIPYLASHSYFPKLLEAGVEIYEYKKGFMHSKILIVDEKISSVGTVNMDIRSFNLNFEVSALLYGEEKVAELVDHFQEDLLQSDRFTTAHEKKSITKRLLESAARLLSPML